MVYVENKGENLAALAYLLKSNESSSVTNPGYVGRHATFFPGFNAIDEKSWSVLKEHETNAAIIEGQMVEHAMIPPHKEVVNIAPLQEGAYARAKAKKK